jgi:hypothetical protein
VALGAACSPIAFARIGPEGRAKRGTRVTRRRLDPDPAKWPPIAQPGVHHAIERHASRHAEIVAAGRLVQPARQGDHRLLQDDLDRMGEIVVARLQRPAALAGRAEALSEAERVDRVLALTTEVDQATEVSDVGRFAERSQGHHLVFVRRLQKPEIFGEAFIEEAERMGHVHLAQSRQGTPLPQAIGRRCPLAAPVEREDRRARERRGVESAGGVGDVVLHEVPAVWTSGPCTLETLREVVGRAARQLARGVDDRGEEERIPGRLPFGWRRVGARFERQGDRRVVAVHAEQQGGIVGIGDVIDIDQRDPGLTQAIVDRVER